MGADPIKPNRVLIVAGGEPWSGALPHIESAISEVIAADSGIHLALELGLPVSVVVGDMDSASPEALSAAERSGARIDRHPEDKEATDLELAIDLACTNGATNIVVLGGAGGRMSHLLGIAGLLGSDKYSSQQITWLLPGVTIHVVTPLHGGRVEGDPKDLVSLIPIGGTASGIKTTGLRWSLENDTLAGSTTRGISNELTAGRADISVADGVLLVVHERPPE